MLTSFGCLLGSCCSNQELVDVELRGKGKGSTWAHKVILSLVSPVLRKMISWETSRAADRVVVLYFPEIDTPNVHKFVEFLYTGKVPECKGVEDLVKLAKIGDMLDVRSLQDVVEDAGCRMLCVATCGALLQCSTDCGLRRLEEQCTQFALHNFEEVSRTPGFLGVQIDVVKGLLGDDRLTCHSEEGVYESLFHWMARGILPYRLSSMDPHAEICKDVSGLSDGFVEGIWDGEGGAHTSSCDSEDNQHSREGLRGPELLKHVRFPLMNDEFLRSVVIVDAELWDCSEMKEAVQEALSMPSDHRVTTAGRTGAGPTLEKWQALRVAVDLKGHAGSVEALSVYGSHMVSGSRDGSIRIWDTHTGRCEASLTLPGGVATGSIYALAIVGDTLFSGSQCRASGPLHAWDLRSRQHESAMPGHVDAVMSIVGRAQWIWSGSWDTSIREWRVSSLECLRIVASGIVGPVLSMCLCGRYILCNGLAASTAAWNLFDLAERPTSLESIQGNVLSLAVGAGPDVGDGGSVIFRHASALGHPDFAALCHVALSPGSTLRFPDAPLISYPEKIRFMLPLNASGMLLRSRLMHFVISVHPVASCFGVSCVLLRRCISRLFICMYPAFAQTCC